jgi:predicted nucleic acid-binding Zn ribbon protein
MIPMHSCPVCRHDAAEDSATCRECGSALRQPRMRARFEYLVRKYALWVMFGLLSVTIAGSVVQRLSAPASEPYKAAACGSGATVIVEA